MGVGKNTPKAKEGRMQANAVTAPGDLTPKSVTIFKAKHKLGVQRITSPMNRNVAVWHFFIWDKHGRLPSFPNLSV